MPLNIVRVPVEPRITKVDFKEHADQQLLTWWYGSLVKGRGNTFQPKVLVCFRELGPNDELTNNFVHRPIGLTELGQFRIGTIWQNQTCRYQIELDVETFQVDFDSGTWRYYSAEQNAEEGRQSFIPMDVYELHAIYQHHKTWLLQFPFSNDPVGLLLPCLEFYSRCYGRSEHVKRVLATYKWDVARSELLAPLVVDAPTGTWPINMKKRTVNGDAVFLAHVEYDIYARRQATSLWSQFEAAQGPSGTDRVFPKIGPWFQGPARLRVKGIWIERGRRFLGLQIVGSSDPDGVPVYRDRENTNKTGPISEAVQKGGAWDGVPPREIIPKNEIVDVTSSETPDHGAGTVEIEEDHFLLLGKPRAVVDMRRPTTNSTKGSTGIKSKADQFSGDETAGTGKGVGYASFNAKTIMESHGTLRDVWDMLKRLEKRYPDIVQKVEYLDAEGNFKASDEPSLIGFEQFTNEERDEHRPKDPNWPLLVTKTGIPRGALLARVNTPKGFIFFFEIQRRPRKIRKDGEKERQGEQPFKGLIFKLDQSSRIVDWTKNLLDRLRYTSGVFMGITKFCPGEAFAFPHKPSSSDTYPQERPVIRAFSLMGIEFPSEPVAMAQSETNAAR